MRIVLIGPPGAGKGTQSRRIRDAYQLPHLSTGEMLRQAVEEDDEVGHQIKTYLEQGRLVPDPLIVGKLLHTLQQEEYRGGFLLDGFPRTKTQAEILDRELQIRGCTLTGAIEFRIDHDELLKRLAGRGRSDDDPQVIERRIESYDRQTRPLVDHYTSHGRLQTIDAVGDPDDVFARVQRAISDLKANDARTKA